VKNVSRNERRVLDTPMDAFLFNLLRAKKTNTLNGADIQCAVSSLCYLRHSSGALRRRTSSMRTPEARTRTECWENTVKKNLTRPEDPFRV